MAKRSKNAGKPGISRYDYDGVVGWYVRYTREGAKFDKLFRDNAFGGSEEALQEAEAYHKQLLNFFPPQTGKELAQRGKTPESGYIGVSRIFNVVKGNTYHFWKAHWSPRYGERKTKVFSVNKYGEEEAKRLAIEQRKRGVEDMEDAPLMDYDKDIVWVVQPEDISIAANVDNDQVVEGKEILAIHRIKERSRDLRTQKVEAFINQHGSLFCEICHFDFKSAYGAHGEGLIEVHHTKAIADCKKKRRKPK